MAELRPSSLLEIFDPETEKWKALELLPNRAQIENPDPEHLEVLTNAHKNGDIQYWNG